MPRHARYAATRVTPARRVAERLEAPARWLRGGGRRGNVRARGGTF